MKTILIYINVLFCATFLIFLLHIILEQRTREFIRKNYPFLLLIIALTVLFKLPFDNSFFHGLEYEDSYLINSSTRYYQNNLDNATVSYSPTSCSVGSLENCYLSSTHDGNLIGLPAINWFFASILGYNPNNISYLNLFLTIVTAISIYLICFKIFKNFLFAILSALVYISTPILNSFHTSGLFETASSAFVVLTLLLFIENLERQRTKNYSITLFAALLTSAMLSIHLKRENIILISFPFLLFICQYIQNRKESIKNLRLLWPYIAGAFIIGLYYWFVLNISSSLEAEREYAQGNSFQLRFFFPLLHMFIKGFSQFKWFYLFGGTLIIGLVAISFDIKRNSTLMIPLLLFAAFILVNILHHRSYYFVRSGEASAFDSLRHINMMSPFYSIICGYGIYKLVTLLSKKIKSTIWIQSLGYAASIGILLHLFLLSNSVRRDLIEIEKKNRLDPISALLQNIDQSKDIVITDQSILLHNYCDKYLFCIDFVILGDIGTSENMRKLLTGRNIYLLRKDYFDNEIFIKRYQKSFEVIENLKFRCISEGEGYKILQINK